MKISSIIGQMRYQSELESIEWKTKAQQIKNRDNVCQVCGTKKELEVHHLVYENRKIWDYPGNYLITLCKAHHKMEHMALDLIKLDLKDALLSGLLAQDIWNKLKNNELIDINQ